MCRQPEKEKLDLWGYLSSYMMPGEGHLIKPPNTLKNKKQERKLQLKKRFRQYYSNWVFNNYTAPLIYEFSNGKVGERSGGQITGLKTKNKLMPVTEPKIQKWIEKVTPRISLLQRKEYARQWNVIAKIRQAKRKGEF